MALDILQVEYYNITVEGQIALAADENKIGRSLPPVQPSGVCSSRSPGVPL